MRISGVYSITNTANGKVYVGSALDIASRWGVHKAGLRANRHHSRPLQNAWNKYGEASFDWHVLREIECRAERLQAEQYYIDSLDATNPAVGYNVCRLARSCAGTPKSKEHAGKISAALKGRRPSEETIRASVAYWKGRKFSDDRRLQMSLAQKGVPRRDKEAHLERMKKRRMFDSDAERQIIVDRKAGMLLRELAEKYGCSTGPICDAIRRHPLTPNRDG